VRRILTVVALFHCTAINLQAGMMITPAGLNPGDQFRVVFVTDGRIGPLGTDHSIYDSFVSAEAVSAGLDSYAGSPVLWQALITAIDGTEAIDRLPADLTVPIFLIDGTLVANNGEDLWLRSLINPINLSPTGAAGIIDRVWTGTGLGGFSSGNPLGSPTLFVTHGLSGETDSSWLDNGTMLTNAGRLYAFSEPLTIPAQSSVPEPSTLTLLGLGSMCLVGARSRGRRRRTSSRQVRS